MSRWQGSVLQKGKKPSNMAKNLANGKMVEDVTRAVQGMKLEVEAAAKGDSLIAIMRTWHQ